MNWKTLSVHILISLLPFLAEASQCRYLFDGYDLIPPEVARLIHPDLSAMTAKQAYADIESAGLRRLDELGVSHQPEPALGSGLIRIIPNTTSSLGKTAKTLQELYGAFLLFDPSLGLRNHGTAFVKFLSADTPLLVLSLQALYQSDQNLRSLILHHERRHLQLQKAQREHHESHFYGEAIAVKGSLPKINGRSVYAKYLSFSEARTYHSQLRMELLRAKKIWDKKPKREAMLRSLHWTVKQLTEVSAAIEVLSAKSLRTVDLSTQDFRFYRDGTGLVAELKYLESENSKIQLNIPLVRAKFFSFRKTKINLLREQLRSTLDTMEVIRAELPKVRELLDELSSQTDTPQAKDILQSALRQLPLLPH